jgi:hypothetical protein
VAPTRAAAPISLSRAPTPAPTPGATAEAASAVATPGPPGGGYGIVVRDQNPTVHDGAAQTGRFVVAAVNDSGAVGVWRRENDRWIDLLPWPPAPSVGQDEATNELTVETLGDDLTLSVNGSPVARVTMGLPDGGVGVFVGGDGNHVALTRLVVRADDTLVRARPTPRA